MLESITSFIISLYWLNHEFHNSAKMKFNYHTEQAKSLTITKIRISRDHVSKVGDLPTVNLIPESE